MAPKEWENTWAWDLLPRRAQCWGARQGTVRFSSLTPGCADHTHEPRHQILNRPFEISTCHISGLLGPRRRHLPVKAPGRGSSLAMRGVVRWPGQG